MRPTPRLAGRLVHDDGPAEPLDRLMHEAEHFRRRALEHHRPDIGIALVLRFDGGFVRLDDAGWRRPGAWCSAS